jgi:type IV pilus assembly protein PilQ
MQNKKLITIFLAATLSGCHSQAVLKKDVQPNTNKARESVVKLREADPPVTEDLRKFDPQASSLQQFKPENIVRIQGNDRGLKFLDSSWNDFPITMNLNVVPIRTFFDSLQRLTKINFVVGDDVKGDVSVNLKEVSWIEAFQIVMRNKNLIGDVNKGGNVVVIHTPDFITDQSTSSQKAIQAKIAYDKAFANLEAKETSIIKLNFARPEIVQQQLREILSRIDTSATTAVGGGSASASSTTVISTRASFILDARTNSIVVHATLADMEWIKSAIANLDRPTKQVLVDVFIVEATDGFQAEIGSRLGYSQSALSPVLLGSTTSRDLSGTLPLVVPTVGAATDTVLNVANNPISAPLGAIGLKFNEGTARLRIELQAMQRERLIKIVSNPKLFIVDNEIASIADGTEVPYTVGGSLGVAPTTSFKEALMKMEVRPSITGEGNVYMSITVNKDSPISGTSPPAISKKQLITKLIIKDGGIAMIGGINKSESTTLEDGVPLFGKIPILGNLFKSKSDINQKNQMYIFLAPKVL